MTILMQKAAKRRFWKPTAILVLILCALCASVWAEGTACPLVGRWAYPHEPKTAVLEVRKDGTAAWLGKNWTWKDEDGRLTLTDAGGESLSLRYAVEDGQPVVYLTTVYRPAEGTETAGLTGQWTDPDAPRCGFVFTDTGLFLEDSTFTGTYTVDEEAGTFRLHYGSLFDDTVCYYALGDGTLTVEYPWPLVPAA